MNNNNDYKNNSNSDNKQTAKLVTTLTDQTNSVILKS